MCVCGCGHQLSINYLVVSHVSFSVRIVEYNIIIISNQRNIYNSPSSSSTTDIDINDHCNNNAALQEPLPRLSIKIQLCNLALENERNAFFTSSRQILITLT